MKKICVFCETWASGGIESFLCSLLTRMDKTGLQVELVAAQVQESVFTPELERCGIPIRQLSGSKGRWLANCRAFAGLLKDGQYDAVHLNAFQGLQLVYLWLAKRAKVPVRIAHSHGSGLRKSKFRSAKLLLHKAGQTLFGRCATERWTCSSQAAAFLFGEAAAARFLPNGIDTEQFRFRPDIREAVRQTLGLDGKFVIGCVGRLLHGKNQSFLLEVLAALLPLRPESMLLLVGEGAALPELRKQAEQLGIAHRVLFYGASRHVEELLWAMDAFAFPSLSEGLGIAAVEAQAAGLPVVASEHIPEEAALTPLFRRVPLTAGAGAWAAALTETAVSRTEYAAAVAAAGFESRDTAALVRAAYLSKSI